MLRVDLEHIIRAACRVAEQDQVLVVGSQSVLGTYSEFELPEESTFSEEADVFPLFDDEDGSRSTQIDGTIGELSQFHQTFGYYAQGVDRRTSTLPRGWADRLVPIRNENTDYFTGWCLDVHDLCSAKLIANREKDRAFVGALIEGDLVLVSLIRERLESTVTASARRDIALKWLNMWGDDQPGYAAPQLPVVPNDWPNHPARVITEQDDVSQATPADEPGLKWTASGRPAAPGEDFWSTQRGQGYEGPSHTPGMSY